MGTQPFFPSGFKKKMKTKSVKERRFGRSGVNADDTGGGGRGHRLCMGSLLGRDTDGPLERPLGPHSLLEGGVGGGGSHGPRHAGGKILLNLCIRG